MEIILGQSWCPAPHILFRRVALDSVSQALPGANNWASSFAKALVDVGYSFLLAPGIMEVVDSTLVCHLLVQQLAAFFVPTPDNIHPKSYPSAGAIHRHDGFRAHVGS
jgi:hypothetical protein